PCGSHSREIVASVCGRRRKRPLRRGRPRCALRKQGPLPPQSAARSLHPIEPPETIGSETQNPLRVAESPSRSRATPRKHVICESSSLVINWLRSVDFVSHTECHSPTVAGHEIAIAR